MVLHIHLMDSLCQGSTQNPTDLYSMCVVSFDQVSIQMESYFVDQKYQFLKSVPLAKDFEKQKNVDIERCKTENKKCFCKQDIAKEKKVEMVN